VRQGTSSPAGPRSWGAEDAGVRYYIPGLAPDTVDEDLLECFSRYGKVLDATVVRERGSDTSRGFGYVRMADASSQNELIGQKHAIRGKEVSVMISKERLIGADLRRIHVDNCTSLAADILRDAFAQFGPVLDVHTPKDFKTGERKRFGFVTFGSEDAFRAAIGAKSITVNGLEIPIRTAAQSRGENVWAWDDGGPRKDHGGCMGHPEYSGWEPRGGCSAGCDASGRGIWDHWGRKGSYGPLWADRGAIAWLGAKGFPKDRMRGGKGTDPSWGERGFHDPGIWNAGQGSSIWGGKDAMWNCEGGCRDWGCKGGGKETAWGKGDDGAWGGKGGGEYGMWRAGMDIDDGRRGGHGNTWDRPYRKGGKGGGKYEVPGSARDCSGMGGPWDSMGDFGKDVAWRGAGPGSPMDGLWTGGGKGAPPWGAGAWAAGDGAWDRAELYRAPDIYGPQPDCGPPRACGSRGYRPGPYWSSGIP